MQNYVPFSFSMGMDTIEIARTTFHEQLSIYLETKRSTMELAM